MPIAIDEPHDAFGADHVRRQLLECALERGLIERDAAAVDERLERVVREVLRRRPQRGRSLAMTGDVGREEHVGADRAPHGLELHRARVQPTEPLPHPRDGTRRDEIRLVDHQEVRGGNLRSRDLGLREEALDVLGVHHRDDRVQVQPGALHAVREWLGIGEARRLDHDQVRLDGLDDLLDRQVEAILVDRAANASARELDHLLDVVQAGDDPAVDPDVTDLVDDQRNRLAAEPVLERVFQQRRLAAAEEARQDVHGDVSGGHGAESIVRAGEPL